MIRAVVIVVAVAWDVAVGHASRAISAVDQISKRIDGVSAARIGPCDTCAVPTKDHVAIGIHDIRTVSARSRSVSG